MSQRAYSAQLISNCSRTSYSKWANFGVSLFMGLLSKLKTAHRCYSRADGFQSTIVNTNCNLVFAFKHNLPIESNHNCNEGNEMAKVKVGTKVTLKAKPGQKKVTFKAGGLHASTGTPAGKPIPAAKMKKAASGGFGAKAKKEVQFKKNVLTGRK